MKGQKLFVRPLAAADLDALEALHSGADEPFDLTAPSGDGLVGRLAGSTVACLFWHRDGDAMSISWFVVAADLRGIRIGRLFLAEAEKLASADGATSLRVAQDCKLARYFERCGFVSERGTLTKTIR
jgi:GNAT superfamily N-acetyltransferase